MATIIGVLHHTFVKHAEEQVGTRLEDSVIHAGKSVDEFMFSPRDFHVVLSFEV